MSQQTTKTLIFLRPLPCFSCYSMQARTWSVVEGIEDNIVCTIFNPILENDKSYCKIAVGGMQDCCEAPEGVGLGDYLT